ncbi:N,N-dimethylformamidase beta subunit family domain-containing protein [Embleya sp. NBC_00896]|uniref:N,N-dimethylformamidase beta subunit family domain-containing protein n=1 Tax=Embleya sp. NBC_00896 TaxID=2975961 RepID=UPI00386AB79C|nr:DUF4082 domain-containing protein [Embleya sp. NBC_00896]
MPGLRLRRATIPTLFALLLALTVATPNASEAGAGPCDAPVANPIVCENSKTGNPRTEWDVSGAGSSSIQGFSTDISVNAGGQIKFRIDTPAASYRIDIYRLGWYNNNGARKVYTIPASAVTPKQQPDCDTDNLTTGLIDCSNWTDSASWSVPADAVSGYYIAKPTRTDGTSGASQIPFVVRNDASHSAMLVQASDTTWQAYNEYGGNSLYEGQPVGRAYKVSYNRPFTVRGDNPEDSLFNAEFPMLRFLERNGYDVTYTTGVDSDRRGQLIKNHKVFVSVGHDEYWSAGQRANVEAARDAGVNLAFFSGNEVFWKTRWENGGINGNGPDHRNLVTYKDTHANESIDPLGPAMWTGTWRDPRFSPPGDGGRPENNLTGTIFTVNCCTTDMTANGADGRLRLWRNTRLATLGLTAQTTLGSGTLGYEWDSDLDNGARPAGLIRMSTTVKSGMSVIQDQGSTYATGSATHSLTLYRAPSGALVFGAGTVQWAWGLDVSRVGANGTVDTAMQQATINLFADMGVQPGTLMSGMVAAGQSTDTTAPTSTITAPSAGGSLPANANVTVTGTAADTGGKVGGVEVSVDNGATWHPATTGRESWTYVFTTGAGGSITIKSRATDDSARTQTPSAGVTVTIGGPPQPVVCPCTMWTPSDQPTAGPDPDTVSTELGVKFQPDRAGFVTGIRFWKDASNTGTHTGTLWNAATQQPLATATFTGETASGWQQVTFNQPVPVTAGTTYVASYQAPNGRYTADQGGLTTAHIRGPLTALASGPAGGNGVYRYGTGFPNSSWNDSNFWVDAVFTTTGTPPTGTPPVVTATTPVNAATSVAVGTTVTATFDEAVQPATIAWSVTRPDTTTVAGTATYNAATRTATFDPTADLAAGTVYTVNLTGAQDTEGTPMAARNWSFTTAGGTPPPTCNPSCTIWPAGATPAVPADSDTGGVELGVKFTSTVPGKITGLRFYKGPGNSGTHTGTLWSSTGTPLATATFTGETGSGWQQVTFAQPFTITAGTTYVASYYAPVGRYSYTEGGLTTQAGTGPVRASASGPAGGNGVYTYGASGFPTSTWNDSNYWVDVVFTTN